MVGNDNDHTLCCCIRKMDGRARNVYKKSFERKVLKDSMFPKQWFVIYSNEFVIYNFAKYNWIVSYMQLKNTIFWFILNKNRNNICDFIDSYISFILYEENFDEYLHLSQHPRCHKILKMKSLIVILQHISSYPMSCPVWSSKLSG